MKNNLKWLRVTADKSLTEVAAAVRVSADVYASWEAGAQSIPPLNLRLLASILNSTEEEILASDAPSSMEDELVDPTLSSRTYAGDLVVEFVGDGDPIAFSLSQDERDSFEYQALHSDHFFVLRSLSNETVAIRKMAVSRAIFTPNPSVDSILRESRHFAAEANLHLPDDRDWEIIEAIAKKDPYLLLNFEPKDVVRIHSTINNAVASCRARNSEVRRKKREHVRSIIFAKATNVIVQMSTGHVQSIYHRSPMDIHDAFFHLIAADGGVDNVSMILVVDSDSGTTISLNKWGWTSSRSQLSATRKQPLK